MEVLAQNRYSSASDVWALGVVVWEIYSNAATPWGELGNLDVVAERVKCGGILSRPERVECGVGRADRPVLRPVACSAAVV